MGGKVFVDTTDFCSIDFGDEIIVDGKRYIVTGHEREHRFGLDDPKFWVKRAIEAESGEKKILKLSFFETFDTSLAGVKIRCFRNPEKEGNILKLVKEHPHFMHGRACLDTKGNNIRILDPVQGTKFFSYLRTLSMPHELYFHKLLPNILRRMIKAFEAISFLHHHGFRHGDIRTDHLFIERETGNYVWIDFDYDYETSENPFGLDIFGLGNVLLYALGKGFYELYEIKSHPRTYGNLVESLEPGDFSVLDKFRLLNLRKIFPYLPKCFNDILLHFSFGADVFYETVDEIIEDLNRCISLEYD